MWYKLITSPINKYMWEIVFPYSDKMTVIQIIVLTLWMYFETIPGFNNGIPNPCPKGMINPVADMCMSSTAIEKNGNGAEYLDSVVLRAMVDRGGCNCDILIENHIVNTGIFIEKYKNMSAATPENSLCGLAIGIEMLNDESVSNPIECTNGVDRRPFSISKKSVLRFTSRIIPGNFTRGYCIHIIRDELSYNKPQRLKIVCNESEILQYDTSSINPTDIIPETNEKDDTKGRDGGETMFISIGASVGTLFIIIVGIIVIVIRRQGCKIKEPVSTENLHMQYDNLSESRNTSNYSTLDRLTIDDKQYNNLSESKNTSNYSTLDRPTIDDQQYEVVL